MTNVNLTFDDLGAGTVVDDEYQAQGVTISSIVDGEVNDDETPAMVFDTSDPTGDDDDLATDNLGNVLIIQEESHDEEDDEEGDDEEGDEEGDDEEDDEEGDDEEDDEEGDDEEDDEEGDDEEDDEEGDDEEDGGDVEPDDRAGGGTLRFDFANPSTMNSLVLLDVEECARIVLKDEHGDVIYDETHWTPNNGQKEVDFGGIVGVASMDVIFYGSGALDNVNFDTPAGLDGTVEGTAGDDVIDVAYTGDPEGDMVDNNDAILPGDVGDDDLIEAYGGDDTVLAGKGDDEVHGGAGNDDLTGGSGDDTIFGGTGNDKIVGDGPDGVANPAPEAKTLVWEEVAADGTQLSGTTSYDAGGINVDIDYNPQDHGATATISDEEMYVETGEGFDGDSSLALYGKGGEGGWDDTSTTTLNFSSTSAAFEDEVQNVAFRINDVDLATQLLDTHVDRVTINAFDADGNPVDVQITSATGDQIIDDNQATGDIDDKSHDRVTPASEEGSILVSIAGPVSSISIDYDNNKFTDQQVNVSDVTFETIPVTGNGPEGNDVLYGGDGDDVIEGNGGDDSIFGGNGSDTVDGGDGNDYIDTSSDLVLPNPDVGYPGVYPADTDPHDDKDLVTGGAGNDTIITGDDDDTVFGGDGDDHISTGFDDDYVEAGAGDDTITGSEGNDEIYGGDGDDTIYGGLPPGPADVLNLPDDLDGDGDSNDPGEDLVTDNNNDTLFGGAGDDTIFGADDDDTLFGSTGDDYLDGGVDDDSLSGGEGEDTLIGGQGADEQDGGLGDDLFIVDTPGDGAGDVVVGGEDPDLDGDGESDDWDVLDLTGSNVLNIDYADPGVGGGAGDAESGRVFFQDGTTMTFEEIENVIPCFTPGTTIATPRGERLVEDLREGDRIITRDNGIQEIRWAGRKDMAGQQLARNPHLKPILIKAGALGNGLPERDMVVSPNHRVLVASDLTQLYFEEREVLAAAKHLVGSEGVHELDAMQTSYIHFMFDRHEVVLSNGCWTESFQPGDYSLKGLGNSQRNEIFELFPELASKPGLDGYQSARRSLKRHEAKLLVK